MISAVVVLSGARNLESALVEEKKKLLGRGGGGL
jgi:hypothetical protein